MDPHWLVVLVFPFLEVFETAQNCQKKQREIVLVLSNFYELFTSFDRNHCPCLLSHISWISWFGVHCFADFLMVWEFGHQTPSCSKPWEPWLENRIRLQHSLWSLFSKQNPHHSLHKVASFCTVPLHKGVQQLFERNQSHFQKERCPKFFLYR